MVRDAARRRARRARSARRGRASTSTGSAQATPTLENTFVAILRDLGGERHAPPFPGRREPRHAGGAVAIGARDLRKTFGAFDAVKGIDLEVRLRRDLRPARRQRRRQDDHDQDALRSARADARARSQLAGERGRAALARRCGSRSATCRRSSRSTTTCTIDENLDFFAGVYRVPRRASATRRSAGCSSSPASRAGQAAHRQPAGRLEAARGLRRGDHARAERAVPRRADLRRRSARAPRVLDDDQPARRPRAPRSWSRRTTSKRPSSATGSASWSPASSSPRARRAASRPRRAAAARAPVDDRSAPSPC